MPTGIELIAAERQRQIDQEGWTAKHDDQWEDGELVKAAISYLVATDDEASNFTKTRESFSLSFWPWELRWWKPKTRRENLIRAGALIAAELDRIERAGPGADDPPICPDCQSKTRLVRKVVEAEDLRITRTLYFSCTNPKCQNYTET